MRREIFINDFRGNDDRPRRGRRDNYGYGRGDGYGRGNRTYNYGDKGRGLHVLGGRRDGEGPHLDEGCNTVENPYPNQRAYKNRFTGYNETSKIKMFSSKKELTEYVNKVGETGQQVDIFKIEDELYKVVVYGNIEVK